MQNNPVESTKDFDAIIIGSGIGGLTTAAILARMKHQRVLVLERHYRAGGFTHTFKRPGGYEWDVGLHYVGDMNEGSSGRKLCDFITAGEVRWSPMPDVFDRFLYPGFTFDVPKGQANYQAALIEKFPNEADAIKRYFVDVRQAVGFFTRHIVAGAVPALLAACVRFANSFASRQALTTTRDYLDAHFKDAQLKAVLTSQWMDYGLPPSQSAFATHALIVNHYLNGAWYPEGGSGVIAESAQRVIESMGGRLLVNHEVQQIVVENGRAIGVDVRVNGKSSAIRFNARLIVSDAGAWNTFQKLLAQSIKLPIRDELKDLVSTEFPAATTATLYLGLNRDPRNLGFKGENYWIFESLDHEAMLTGQDQLLDGKTHGCYLSFPSLKNPLAQHHTAEIIAPLSYSCLEKFRNEPWRRRSLRYQEMKAAISKALLASVEASFPGFGATVAFSELSTPLTIEHFTDHPKGAIYGLPATPARYRKSWLKPDTPVNGVYLTGVDAGSLGIMGAMMGGVSAAARIIGPFGFFSIMAAAMRNKANVKKFPVDTSEPTRVIS